MLSRVLALGVLAAALLTLAGWAARIPRLTDWDNDGIAQLPNNALGIAVASGALLCVLYGRRRAAILLSAVSAAIGIATLFEHLTGVNLRIDALLLPANAWGQRGAVAPGRMGPPGSTSLTLVSISVLLLAAPRLRRFAVSGGILIVSIAMLSIIGYLFAAGALYSVPRFTAIAFQTSLMLLALGVAVVAAAPDLVPLRYLHGDSAAALLVRSALPATILVPIFVGWLCVRGQEAGLYGTAFGTALLVLLLIAFLVGLLLWCARAVFAHESEVRASRDRLAAMVESMAATAEALRAADRMKDEFLATLSHEMRTPLTAIVGWSHMLLAGSLDKREQQIALEAIRSSARAQAQLIDDVLDVSRITTGKMRLERAGSDLAAVVEAAVAAVRPAAEAKRIVVRVAAEGVLPRMFVDAERIQQVVWNLLSNAIKFSPERSAVDVTLRAAAGHLQIEVSDQGPGIAAAFLPHLFERFRQADSSSSRAHAGLGIGLALSKELAELHGGTIAVETEEGRGSRFVVTLPVMEGEAAAAAGAERAEAPLSGVRVLYVDDRADARLLVSSMLRRHGADVLQAASVADALTVLADQVPHIVVTDLAMPERDGFDLLAAVRANAAWDRLPVVALTAQGRIDDEARATRAGFASFLRKPIEPEALAAAVSRALGAAGVAAG